VRWKDPLTGRRMREEFDTDQEALDFNGSTKPSRRGDSNSGPAPQKRPRSEDRMTQPDIHAQARDLLARMAVLSDARGVSFIPAGAGGTSRAPGPAVPELALSTSRTM
jgi:hypothetical protein